MSKVVFSFTLAVIIALSILALENPVTVQLRFFQGGPVEVPLYMVMFGAFVLGALFVYVLLLLQGVRGVLLGRREKRIRKRDERSDAYRQEARNRLRLGDLGKAKSLLEKAAQLSPDNLEIYLDLADVLLEGKEYQEASDRYHHVFSMEPENIRGILGIAASSEGSGNFSEAEFYYARVLEMEKGNPVALRALFAAQKAQKKWQDAMETLRILKKEGHVSAEGFDNALAVLWYEQGMKHEESGDLKGSISSFEKSLKEKSEFLPALLSLGEAYIRDGSPDRAIKTWENALLEKFQLPLARALENYLIEHEGEKALIQFYKKASSRNEFARLLLAKLYLRLDRVEEAETEISGMPDVEGSPSALILLAQIEKKRLNEALANQHYRLAMELFHHQLQEYRCRACNASHDKWMSQCRRCGAWDTLDIDRFLP
ncbi:MAG: DUF1049 domain-containing protein [Proteobacteria bacterium]|nr:DUF1049 domain-containing protein [Pseudomonadota bacterium]NIS69626.1 DUF1049 domain-containing protein [Pseudomonadota bacterium]